jgi:hypothetical protein
MSDAKLRAVVQEIRGQLAGAEGLSPTARRSLEELVRDLEALVDSPPGTVAAASKPIRDRLADSVRRLEASHPVLSATLGNVIDALAFFGL